MNNEQYIADLISRYLSGQLSGEELQNFEQKLGSDADFAQEVAFEKIIQKAVIADGLLAWKNDIRRELRYQKKIQFWKWILGSILLFSSIGLGFYLYPNQKKNTQNSAREIVKQNTTIQTPLEETKTPTESPTATQQNTASLKPKEELKMEQTKHVLASESIPVTVTDSLPKNPKQVSQKEKETTNKPLETNHIETKNPCLSLSYKPIYTITQACEGKNNGRISIELADKSKIIAYKLHTESWSKTAQFSNLKAGEYFVSIRSIDNCETAIPSPVILGEKECYEPEAAFNPNYETWEYKQTWEQTARIKIRNREGRIVFEKNINTTFVWDGTDLQGKRVESGLYVYTIETKELIQGTVTVIY